MRKHHLSRIEERGHSFKEKGGGTPSFFRKRLKPTKRRDGGKVREKNTRHRKNIVAAKKVDFRKAGGGRVVPRARPEPEGRKSRKSINSRAAIDAQGVSLEVLKGDGVGRGACNVGVCEQNWGGPDRYLLK